MSTSRWFLYVEGTVPQGPFEEHLVLQGLEAGRIPLEARVMREGGKVWSSLQTTPPFATVVQRLASQEIPEAPRPIQEEATAPPTLPKTPSRAFPALWVFAFLFAGIAGILGLLCLKQPTRTAEGTSRELLQLLSAGEVVKLRARKDLGQSARIHARVRALGGEELERRRAILARAVEAGGKLFLGMEQRAKRAGEEEFRKLPQEEQRRIRDASRLDFLLSHGFSRLSSEEQTLLVSVEEMQDPKKRAALVRRLGERTLAAQEQQQLRDGDPADPAVQSLAARAATAGEQEFNKILQRTSRAGQEAWDELPAAQQKRIGQRSLQLYIYEQGLKALKKEELAQLGSAQAFLEEKEALLVRFRALGLPTLTPQERAEVDSLPEEKKEGAVDAFVEEHGTRLTREELVKDMAAGGYSLTDTSYRGRGAHSLLRSTSARVGIAFEEDREVPARKWLPPRIILEQHRGHYRIPAHDGSKEALSEPMKLLERWWFQEKTDPALEQAGEEFLTALGRRVSAGLVSADLIVLGFLGATLWLLVRKRPEGLLSLEEGVALLAALLIAAVQHLAQGQISADDWFATPLYLALPGFVGALRGPRSGYVAGVVVGLSLLAGATLFRITPEPRTLLDLIPFAEFTLFAGILGLVGLLVGVASKRPVVAALPPLLWILGSALLQQDLLWSPPLYGRCALAVALSAAWLALRSKLPDAPPRPLLDAVLGAGCGRE
jgi:hypothetical protein